MIKVAAVELAKAAGSAKAANIVALSAFVERSKIVSMETLRKCIKHELSKKAKLIPLNMAAVEEGIKAAH